MRLFIAVPLSKEMKASVTDTLHSMKVKGVKGNYVPTGNLHLTLAFIGELKDPVGVQAAMETVRLKPFRLALSDLGTFGDLLWAGIKGNQGLTRTVKEIRAALDNAGIAYDKKKFVPHITLIRKMAGNWKSVPAPKGEMIVNKVSLMRSDRKGGKQVYTEIYHIGKDGR